MNQRGNIQDGNDGEKPASLLERLPPGPIKSTSAWGDLQLFILFILVFVVARFLSILVHELGHGMLAIALGGDFYALYASPSTGCAYVYLGTLSWSQRVLVAFGGILFQVIIGMVIFVVYSRFTSFLAKVFSLQLLVVLLVYPFLYLGLSVFYGGDGMSIVDEISKYSGFDATIPLAVISIFFGVVLSYFISKRVLSFLDEYFPLVTRADRLHTTFLFFSVPLIIGFVGAVMAMSIVPLASIQFLIAFVIVAHILFYIELRIITRTRKPEAKIPKKVKVVSGTESKTIIMSFAVTAVLWLACFGPTPSTAYGILLIEPPIEAEKDFADLTALNVDIKLDPSRLEVVVTMREIVAQPSPLEHTIWRSFDERAYWSYYENRSRFILTRMLGITEWQIDSRSIGTEVYGFDTKYNNPRIIGLSIMSPDDALENTSGIYTLRIYDPWQNGPTESVGNYLHMLNVSWSDEFSLITYSSEPQKAPRSDFASFLEWRNHDVDLAPYLYIIEFERA